MAIHEAIELIALAYFDGKIEDESRLETEMCKGSIDQIKNNPDLSPRTLALCWLYCQAHATDPLGQFIKVLNHILLKIYKLCYISYVQRVSKTLILAHSI